MAPNLRLGFLCCAGPLGCFSRTLQVPPRFLLRSPPVNPVGWVDTKPADFRFAFLVDNSVVNLRPPFF